MYWCGYCSFHACFCSRNRTCKEFWSRGAPLTMIDNRMGHAHGPLGDALAVWLLTIVSEVPMWADWGTHVSFQSWEQLWREYQACWWLKEPSGLEFSGFSANEQKGFVEQQPHPVINTGPQICTCHNHTLEYPEWEYPEGSGIMQGHINPWLGPLGFRYSGAPPAGQLFTPLQLN